MMSKIKHAFTRYLLSVFIIILIKLRNSCHYVADICGNIYSLNRLENDKKQYGSVFDMKTKTLFEASFESFFGHSLAIKSQNCPKHRL